MTPWPSAITIATMKERSTTISTPEEAKKIKAKSESEFSSKTALRLFDRIAKATLRSKGREVEFEFTGRTTSLSELVTADDISFMKKALKAKGWGLNMHFIEGEEDPGHYAPGWQNFIDVNIWPITSRRKTRKK